jgi:hypothetical protein
MMEQGLAPSPTLLPKQKIVFLFRFFADEATGNAFCEGKE